MYIKANAERFWDHLILPTYPEKLGDPTMQHHKLRDIVSERNTLCVDPATCVVDVVREMQDRRIGAALVVDGAKLVGIFTGANFVQEVLDIGRDPVATKVSEVMTPNPKCLDCSCDGFEAVRMMKEYRIRHVVVPREQGGAYDVVSITDFPDSELEEYEDELAFEQRLWEEM